ncbi:MAG: acetate/propionate family kinase [Rhodospirillales bacterium]|nr:acetate/propionate family kinase [Rhodospirillales bacterium]MCB9995525.1 acetate/propionate family kinase [Rhodospirillales bacterium]
MSKPQAILVINAGSSSIKTKLYAADDLRVLDGQKIEITDEAGYDKAFADILDQMKRYDIVGVGHRVVHGGRDFNAPQVITPEVLEALEALVPLAPLHQPHNIRPVEQIARAYPNVPQVACFDTSFHRTMPRLNEIYAIPRALTDEGMIKYGFHGLSYEYISSVLPEVADETAAKGRVIVAHLGNGASMCAMKDGKSVATSMGFTPLDGLMMGTRSGSIDPGLPLHLIEQKGMAPGQVSKIFQKESGLKGVSGISSDMRVLLQSSDPAAKEAVDLFCLQAARQAASLVVDLGGLDALVFTAGIGENAPEIREKICAHLAHLGVNTESAPNSKNETAIHAPGSKVPVYVIPTDEGLMIARHTKALVLDKTPAPVVTPSRKL